MKKCVLTLVMIAFFVFLLVPVTAAQTIGFEPNGKFLMAIAPPEQGSIPISSREELQKIGNDKNYPLSGKYHLTADIDLSGVAWTPIGTRGYTSWNFTGTFDGQGYIIKNLTVMNGSSYIDARFGGLFGYASSDAVIKNMGLENINIAINYGTSMNAYIYVGGIVGQGGNISNCYVTGDISATVNSGYAFNRAYAGGISGADSNINNCYAIATVTASSNKGIYSARARAYAGGISGCNEDGFSITNCYSSSSVTAETVLAREFGSSLNPEKDICSFAGGISGYGVAGNSYWNMDKEQSAVVYLDGNIVLSNNEKKGLGHGIGQVTALTTEQMKQQSSFSGWDFNNIWTFIPGENNGYPILSAFHPEPPAPSTPEPSPQPVLPTSANPLDTASSWARADLSATIAKGFVPADLQDNYTNTITRAEFCRLAVKWLEYKSGKSIDALLNKKGVSRSTNAFSDTNDPDILAAFALGIINGSVQPTADKPGTFNPNGQFNREMAATLIRNVCRAAGIDVSNVSDQGFSDIGTAADWAKDGINFVRASGIMGGTSTTPLTFSPQMPYSREQSILTFNNIG